MWSRSLFSIAHLKVSLYVALCAILVLAGCARTPDDVLRFGVANAPTALDPRYATDANAARLCRLIYSALVDFDVNFMPRPALAKWDVIAPTHYRFHLPTNTRFHNGRRLVAADVVATYESVLDERRASPLRGSFANLQRVTAYDETTVDFKLKHPDPLFPGLLTIGILPAADAQRPQLPAQPIGSGPFQVVSAPTPTRISLVRFSDQQRVDFITVPNETTRALMLARGELDLAQGGFTPELVTWLATRNDIRVSYQHGTVFTYLGFNLHDGPTQDLRVRQALAFAIDRPAITHYLFHDQARLANAILAPEHWASANLEPIPFDPARARTLLAAAGFNAVHPLVLDYKTSNDYFRRRLATVLQSQLKAVNVDLNVRSLDWGTYYDDIKNGRFALFGLSWVGLQLPDIFRHAFHSAAIPPLGANRGHYVNPAVDSMIEKAEDSNDLAQRAALYRSIQAQLQHDLPYLPLWFEDIAVVQRARVIGYATDPNGNYDGLTRVNALKGHARATALKN